MPHAHSGLKSIKGHKDRGETAENRLYFVTFLLCLVSESFKSRVWRTPLKEGMEHRHIVSVDTSKQVHFQDRRNRPKPIEFYNSFSTVVQRAGSFMSQAGALGLIFLAQDFP